MVHIKYYGNKGLDTRILIPYITITEDCAIPGLKDLMLNYARKKD